MRNQLYLDDHSSAETQMTLYISVAFRSSIQEHL